MRLVDQTRVRWQNRAHFFAIAAQTMRRILIDHARRRRYDKRGGGPPTQLTSFTSDDVLNFDVARDGRLLLARGGSTSSVVMLGGWR